VKIKVNVIQSFANCLRIVHIYLMTNKIDGHGPVHSPAININEMKFFGQCLCQGTFAARRIAVNGYDNIIAHWASKLSFAKHKLLIFMMDNQLNR
jgi:hypothetical protein